MQVYAWATIGGNVKEIFQSVTVKSGVQYEIVSVKVDGAEKKINCVNYDTDCEANYGDIESDKLAVITIKNTGAIDSSSALQNPGTLQDADPIARYEMAARGEYGGGETHCEGATLLKNGEWKKFADDFLKPYLPEDGTGIAVEIGQGSGKYTLEVLEKAK